MFKKFCAGVACCLFCLSSVAQAGVVVDLNKTSSKELANLSTGMDDPLINALLAERDRLGGFKTPEQVLKVPGMTQQLFDALTPYVLRDTVVIDVEEPHGVSPY